MELAAAPTGSPARNPSKTPKTLRNHLRDAVTTTLHHAKKHVGMGLICSVAYFDP